MKVILQEDVKKVGLKGEVVEVSDGYGRNYLLPRKLAIEANVANLNSAKVKAENKARKARQEADEAKLLARAPTTPSSSFTPKSRRKSSLKSSKAEPCLKNFLRH